MRLGTSRTRRDRPAAAAFVGQLPDDGKQCLLVALLEDAIALTGGNGLISVQTLDGKDLGYYVPPKASERGSSCTARS